MKASIYAHSTASANQQALDNAEDDRRHLELAAARNKADACLHDARKLGGSEIAGAADALERSLAEDDAQAIDHARQALEAIMAQSSSTAEA